MGPGQLSLVVREGNGATRVLETTSEEGTTERLTLGLEGARLVLRDEGTVLGELDPATARTEATHRTGGPRLASPDLAVDGSGLVSWRDRDGRRWVRLPSVRR